MVSNEAGLHLEQLTAKGVSTSQVMKIGLAVAGDGCYKVYGISMLSTAPVSLPRPRVGIWGFVAKGDIAFEIYPID